jgi:hypothetical protein
MKRLPELVKHELKPGVHPDLESKTPDTEQRKRVEVGMP